MPLDEERSFWLRRLEATGKAQARYLWLLLLTGLFFGALRVRAAGHQTITVPVVDLDLNAPTVLAAGGPILAFLVLAVMGAIRAWTTAVEQIRGRPPRDTEPLDVYPNALDLALYTTDQSPALLRNVLYFAYPLYLAAALVESAWLQDWLLGATGVPGRTAFLVVGCATWFIGVVQVLRMWGVRIKKVASRKKGAS